MPLYHLTGLRRVSQRIDVFFLAADEREAKRRAKRSMTSLSSLSSLSSDEPISPWKDLQVEKDYKMEVKEMKRP